MAGLRKLKGVWFARVYIPRPAQKPREKLIGLDTDDLKEAAVRRSEVERHETEIKAGIELVFPWKNGKGYTQVVRLTLEDAIDQYLRSRKADRLRESTLDLDRLALKAFSRVVGKSIPVEVITYDHVEKFKTELQENLSSTTVNIRLRCLRTFLNWLHERGKLERVPRIRQLNVGNPLPIYLSNTEFAEIQKAVSHLPFKNPQDSSHYQRAFHLYRETGLRLAEPFHATVAGNWMIILAENAKTHSTREVFLTPELHEIVDETRDRFERYQGKNKRDFALRYSKIFKAACRKAKIKGKKFHCLRHTFAVRRYLQTRDIYQVAKEMGHASVRTTEIYARFNMRRLEEDFPDLATAYQVRARPLKFRHGDTESPDTEWN